MGRQQDEGKKDRIRECGEKTKVEAQKKELDESFNFRHKPELQRKNLYCPVHVTSSHLSRTSLEVLLQHAQLNDITGVPDDCHYGNRAAAPDVAVETFGTVKAEWTGHPKPRL